MRQIFLAFMLVVKPIFAYGMLDNFEHAVADGQIVLPLILALIAGVFTSLSPCVYPLIPISLSIMGVKRYESHLQGFLIALCYVFGMSLVYAALGATFASLGILLGAIMQNPLVLWLIAGLCLLMALSMFGVFEFVLPSGLVNRFSKIGGLGFRGAFLMGMVAGVIAAPCTGPVLGFILTLIANKRDLVQGISLMVAFSMGIGAPFLILGTFFSAVTRLPKAGPWMNSIKYIFGAVMLGTAVYYGSLASTTIFQVLEALRSLGTCYMVSALLIGMLLLCVRIKRWPRAFGIAKSTTGALIASLSITLLLMFDEEKATVAASSYLDVDWHTINANLKGDFDQVLQHAKTTGRPVLIDFFADWCIACKQLDLLTLKDERVAEELRRFTLIRVDSSLSASHIDLLQNRFKVVGLPTIAFVSASGELSHERVLGFLPPEQFLTLLRKIQ